MKCAWTSVLLLSLALVATQSVATDCHTGSDVTIHLTSPSAPGTYTTPARFTATASSSKTITGYVVYQNASGSYVDAYQNAKTTLDAWVILPLTASGGPQSQSVFVRAWNSGGFCGDSSILAVTASGTHVPTVLAGSTAFNNADDDQTGDGGITHGWGDCGDPACSGGVNTATVSFAFGQLPEKDTNGSIRFTVTGGNNANGLFHYKVGAQNTESNFLWDFWFQLSSTTSTDAQAIEFDLFQSINGKKYMFGTQCNYATGVWQAWNDVTVHWINAIPNTATDGTLIGSPLTCAMFSTGAWHHAQFFLQRTYGGRLQYGNVSIDGLTTQWNITAPASNTTWSDVLGINHQLDTNASFTGSATLQEWADLDDITAWPQD
jgi:hypothetical protein